MDRQHPAYTLLQYGLLIFLLFGVVAGVELVFGDVPLWVGLVLAVVIGIGYPRLTRRLGIAPRQWE